jgi:hypothetical protein
MVGESARPAVAITVVVDAGREPGGFQLSGSHGEVLYPEPDVVEREGLDRPGIAGAILDEFDVRGPPSE